MKIERAPRQTPAGASQDSSAADSRQSTAGGLERRVWEELAPRLIHPTKLAFIQLLLESGEPLALRELAEATKIAEGPAEQHCRRMEAAGVLEVMSAGARPEGGPQESFYFFPEPAEPPPASPPTDESD